VKDRRLREALTPIKEFRSTFMSEEEREFVYILSLRIVTRDQDPRSVIRRLV
jgi:hypothetical protein